MTGLILLISICVLFTLLLLTRIQLILNTDRSDYRLRIGSLANARVRYVEEGDLELTARLVFWNWKLSFMSLLTGQGHKQQQQVSLQSGNKKIKSKRRVPRRMLTKGWRLMRSFKVRKWYLNVDTDDVIANAYLYPFFFWLSRGKAKWKINYEGRVDVDILIENRIGRMLYCFIR